MYETKLKAMKTELEKLKWCTAVPVTRLSLPFQLGHDEITEKSNDGFSKKFVKIARQAVLVALKKESNLNCASASVVNYLRETRKSQNWLCVFGKESEEIFLECH